MVITWQEGNNPLFGVLLASFYREFVKDLHLHEKGRELKHELCSKIQNVFPITTIEMATDHYLPADLWPIHFYLSHMYQSKFKMEGSERSIETRKGDCKQSRNRVCSRNTPWYSATSVRGVITHHLKSHWLLQLQAVSLWSLRQQTRFYHPHLSGQKKKKIISCTYWAHKDMKGDN